MTLSLNFLLNVQTYEVVFQSFLVIALIKVDRSDTVVEQGSVDAAFALYSFSDF